MQRTRFCPPYETEESVELRPTEVVVAERERANSLAGDVEDCLRDGGRDLRNGFLAHARDPLVVGLQELNIDLRRIIFHPRNSVLMEVLLSDASVLDRDLLPHRIAQAPGDL